MDYETLKLIWWGLVLFLLIGFVVMDGFDLGVGMLLPVVANTDEERRVLLNSVGPVWEGNQVWLIAGAGTLFAAWPLVYAASFSALYVPFMFLLFGLFLRPVGFDYRSKLPDPLWRRWWDRALVMGLCCRPWCLARPSASCCKACRFASIRTFASTTAPSISTGRCC